MDNQARPEPCPPNSTMSWWRIWSSWAY